MARRLLTFGLASLASAACPGAQAGAPLSPNRADEPRAAEFDLARSVAFGDSVAVAWRASYGCVTCHTNGLHLAARAWVGAPSRALDANRDFARRYLARYVRDGAEPEGRKGQIEGLVATTALLAISELRLGGALSPTTEKSFAHVFERQHEDGHWPGWIKCMWPPFEVDDHFGVSLAAVAVGMAPRSFRTKPPIRAGLARLRSYLAAHPPANPHHKGMLLWASRHLDEVVSPTDRKAWVTELRELQRADGGWRLCDLGAGQWVRADGSAQDRHSDAYATAFCVFVLRQADVLADDPTIARGVAWLKSEQRASGRWFTRSPKRDRRHFISHAATHFAVMALVECGESLR